MSNYNAAPEFRTDGMFKGELKRITSSREKFDRN
jgi:hypothetical protein